jgi:predicted AlkP superfamily phosphohydrolase/phosphomutase
VSTPALTVIGLDAATFSVIDPMIEHGELPHLARLLSEGVSGTLRSTTHPLTPQAWTTMVTGVNAGRHGIWDFAERDETGYGLRLVNGGFRRAPAIWDRLTKAGRSSGLVNIPFTWPAPAVQGFALAGFDAADLERGMTYPDTLLGELRRRFGAFQLDHRFPLGADGSIDIERVRREAAQKVEIALWLSAELEPELFFTVFMAGDHVQHLCWTDWERDGAASPLAECYRILDEAAGALAGAAAGGDVLVVSDHGAGRLDGVVNLNTWLEQNGYLTYVGQGAAARRRLADRVLGLRRHVPEGVRRAVKQRVPGLRARARELEEYTIVDWDRTRAFAYGIFGNVVLNVRGREAQGTVEPGDEYERLRAELADRLATLAGPDGERIVRSVHRREDLFLGPEIEKVPDLLVEFDDYAWLGKGTLKTRSESLWDAVEIEEGSAHSYVGSHRHDGILALHGPSARAGADRISASIEDVAPTILYLLGEPLPGDLEGRVLTEAIAPSVLDARPPAYDDEASAEIASSGISAEDTEEVERRLRDLGYLE